MKKLLIVLLMAFSVCANAQQQGRTVLKSYFETGDVPTQANFETLINSMYNIVDDRDTIIFVVPLVSDTTDLETGTLQQFRMPIAFTVTGLRASLDVASGGASVIFDVNEGGTSILGTKIYIDPTETDSDAAGTSYTLTDANIAEFAIITIDCDQIGSTAAGKGGELYITGVKQ